MAKRSKAGAAQEEGPAQEGTGAYDRAALVAECEGKLRAEGMEPFAAELLAHVYATSYELQLFQHEARPFLEFVRQLGAGNGRRGILGRLARVQAIAQEEASDERQR